MNVIISDACWNLDTGRGSIGVHGRNITYSRLIRASSDQAAEIISILQAALLGYAGNVIWNDNKQAVNAINNNRPLKCCQKLCENAAKLIRSKKLIVKWVRRHKTKKADKLARECIKNG